MKYTKTMLLTVLSLFAACSDGGLTKPKAQKALNEWRFKAITFPAGVTGISEYPGGTPDTPIDVAVQGIQEILQQNAAKADLSFSAFKYGPHDAKQSYSGSGTAYFSHYNDGRWVLTRVEIPGKEWRDINIDAN